MLKGLDSVNGLARSFDNTPMYETVKAFLESPFRGVKPLIVTDPGIVVRRKVDAGQATLCSKVNALTRRYPFNRNSDDDVGLDQLNDVFAPTGGALGAVRQLLGENIIKTGSLWTAKPDAQFKLSRSFLGFFNQMSAISDALYPQQGAKPGMHYKLVVRPNPGVKQVKGLIDGDIFSMNEKQYSWPSAKPGVDLRIEQSGGGDFAFRAYPGIWAIFQLLSGADRHTPGSNQFGLVNVQAGKRSLAQAVLPDSSAIVIEVVEFPNGVQRAFDSDFFRIGACPVKATED
jgi:type VI protein secretion system component VasK